MVGAADVGLGQSFRRCAGGDEVGVEQDGVVEVAAGGLDIVDHDEHRAPARDPGSDEAEEFAGSAQVETGEGLVEQEDVGTLREGAGEENALLLPAGEGVQGTLGEVGEFEFGEGFGDAGVVGGGETTEEAESGQAALRDDGADVEREIPVDGLALREVGEAGQGVARVGVADANLARVERVPAEERAQERAFARAVGAAKRDGAAAGQIGGDSAQGGDATVVNGNVAQADDVVGGRMQEGGHRRTDVVREESP